MIIILYTVDLLNRPSIPLSYLFITDDSLYYGQESTFKFYSN